MVLSWINIIRGIVRDWYIYAAEAGNLNIKMWAAVCVQGCDTKVFYSKFELKKSKTIFWKFENGVKCADIPFSPKDVWKKIIKLEIFSSIIYLIFIAFLSLRLSAEASDFILRIMSNTKNGIEKIFIFFNFRSIRA